MSSPNNAAGGPGCFSFVEFEKLMEKVQQMWKNAPQDVRDSMPSLGAIIAQFGSNVYAWCSTENLREVLHFLKPENACSHTTAAARIGELATNNATIASNQGQYIEIMTNTGVECPKAIENEVKKSFASTGNWLLISSAIAGAVQLVMQVLTLHKLFQVMETAEEEMQLSQAKRKTIKARIDGIQGRLSALDPLLQELKNPKLSQFAITAINVRFQVVERSIMREVDDVLNEIGSLHSALAEAVNNVKAARSGAFTAGIGGGVGGISGLINVGVLAGAASPWLAGIVGVISAANVIASGVGFWKCSKAKDQLKKLVGELEEVEKLRRETLLLRGQLQMKTDMILNTMVVLTENVQ